MIYTLIIFIIELVIFYGCVANYTNKIEKMDYNIIVNFHFIIGMFLLACVPILNNLVAAYMITLTFDDTFMREHF